MCRKSTETAQDQFQQRSTFSAVQQSVCISLCEIRQPMQNYSKVLKIKGPLQVSCVVKYSQAVYKCAFKMRFHKTVSRTWQMSCAILHVSQRTPAWVIQTPPTKCPLTLYVLFASKCDLILMKIHTRANKTALYIGQAYHWEPESFYLRWRAGVLCCGQWQRVLQAR